MGPASQERISNTGAHACKPYVGPLVWAYYEAFEAIVVTAIAKMMALKGGIKIDLVDDEALKKVVLIVLPHQKKFIENAGANSLGMLLPEIENLLLISIRDLLRGKEADEESLNQAMEISATLRESRNRQSASDVPPQLRSH